MAKASPIDIVEAAYGTGRTREAWLRGVLEAAEPILQPSTFVGGYFIDMSGRTGGAMDGALTLHGSPLLAQMVTAFHRGLPDASRLMYESAARRGAAMASELLQPLGLWPIFEQLGASQARIGVPMVDLLGVVALDAAGRGLFIGCGYDRRVMLDRAMRARWTRSGVHLAAGERLRRALDGRRSEGEAILTPSGRVEHAVGEAKAAPALRSLRIRTVAIDRARGRQRRSDPDAALEAWRGLIAGRWSLVDRFESDGRRYVVAHRNEPTPARMLALTLRERQVVAHRLAGHSSKVAAYALGVSPAAVSGALRSAMLKLGVRSVPQLVHRMGSRIVEASAHERR